MTFKELGLVEPILKALDQAGHVTPTPIQEQAIPHILQKKDLLGCAQTGTGKTAAFALPLIQSLITREKPNYQDRKIKVLILSPTRELAIQTRDNFRKYGINTDLKCSVILGGVNQSSQVEVLKKGVDILVATPGRLLDLINQRHVKLNNVEVLVLDEADTMLDMGFIHDVKKIITHIPSERQTLLFSATMPNEINNLVATFLKDHVTVKVNSVSSTVDKINQSLYYVDKSNKTKLLTEILTKHDVKSTLIFTRTKHGANKLAEILGKSNITCEVIHGNKSQNARVLALSNFKSGKSKVLVATDIAARGIDIAELSHVVNFEIPNLAETYVHRIGRTGRAGLEGTAISLCDIDEKAYLKDIQKLIKQEITIVDNHNYPMQQFNLTPKAANNSRGNRSFSNNKNYNSNRSNQRSNKH
jgi:ATP-dependent RNA helicase RhlE